MDAGWCTIESDPAVFTEMLEKFGVKDVVAEELVSIDDDSLKALGTRVYGLIMLFKWKPQESSRQVSEDTTLYFAKQIVPNACATQAIVNILLNHADVVDIGPELKNLLEFTQGLDAHMRGEMIGQSDVLRDVHNSFARPSVFSFESRQAKEDDDVYHFIGYTFKNDAVWELDGLQRGPILIGEATNDTWRSVAAAAIQARMSEIMALDTTGAGQGISFSLMALTNDRQLELEAELARLREAEAPTGYVEAQLADVREQRARGRVDNQRRRHNYFPMLVELLRALAEKGKLQGIVEANQKKVAERKAAKKVGSK